MLDAYCYKDKLQVEADLAQCLVFIPDHCPRLKSQAGSVSGGQQ